MQEFADLYRQISEEYMWEWILSWQSKKGEIILKEAAFISFDILTRESSYNSTSSYEKFELFASLVWLKNGAMQLSARNLLNNVEKKPKILEAIPS